MTSQNCKTTQQQNRIIQENILSRAKEHCKGKESQHKTYRIFLEAIFLTSLRSRCNSTRAPSAATQLQRGGKGAKPRRNFPYYFSPQTQHADSFISALLVVGSKGEGEGEGEQGEGELFDKFFVAFVFQLKPGILALNESGCKP